MGLTTELITGLVGAALIVVMLLLFVVRRRSRENLVGRVLALAEAGQWTEVVALLAPLEGQSPPNPLLFEHLCRAYLRSGNLDKARRIGRRVVQRRGRASPHCEVVARVSRLLDEITVQESYHKGLSAFRSGRWSAAVRFFQKIPEDTRPSMASIYLIICLVHMGQVDTAQDKLEKLDTEEAANPVLYRLAVALHETGLLAESRRIFEEIVARDAHYHDAAARLESVKRAERDGGKRRPQGILDLVRTVIPERYQLREKLGMGGMGIVVLARDTQKDLDVAIKILSPILADNGEIRRRFQLEASALRGLEHPNVVRIFDLGEGSIPYYVMEYLQGRSLKEWIDEGGLPIRDHLYIASQVAAALEHAHRNEVVHRDVKPDNVIIEQHCLVKLVDFGLAKRLDGSTLSQTDAVVGTQAYMAPEQITGDRIDGRTDVYSFGVMLYHQFTGVPPFTDNPLWEHVHRVPTDPARLNSALGQRLRRIILTCLEKDPQSRFQRMSLVEGELKEAMREASAATPCDASVLLGEERS